MTMTTEQQAAVDAYNARKQKEGELKEKTPSQFVRTALQGLTFKTADEIEAFIRSAGPRDRDELLAEIRGNLKEFSKARPIAAGATEIGGALLPTIIATIMSGGTALPAVGAYLSRQAPGLGRILGSIFGTRATNTIIGGGATAGVQGGLTGAGGGENTEERIEGAVYGTLVGVPTGVVTTVGGQQIGKGLNAFIDFARRRYGERASQAVAREVQRLAKERGIDEETAYQYVKDGNLLAENATFRDIMRTYRAGGGKAAEILREGLTERPSVTRKQVSDYLETSLVGGTGQNLITKQSNRINELRDKAETFYESEFRDVDVPSNMLENMKTVFRTAPQAFGAIKRAFTTGDKKFPFKMEDGQMKFDGDNLTIADAEMVRRQLQLQIRKFKKLGEGDTMKNYIRMEDELRKMIDDISPETKAARATWNKMSKEAEAYDNARDLFKSSPIMDEVEIGWNDALANGDEAIKAFRLGALTKLRQMLKPSTAPSVIKKMLNEDEPIGQALKEIFPEQNLPNMIQKLRVAKDANAAANEILGQSPTAITNALLKQQGKDYDLMDLAVDGATTLGIARLAMNILKKNAPELSEKQRGEFVTVMMSRDADEIKNIISSENGYILLEKRIKDLLGGAQAAITREETARVDAKERFENVTGFFGR